MSIYCLGMFCGASLGVIIIGLIVADREERDEDD